MLLKRIPKKARQYPDFIEEIPKSRLMEMITSNNKF